MIRREFITLLGGAAAAGPLAVPAQEVAPRFHRIGILASGPMASRQRLFEAFATRLRDLGWAEGHNLEIEYRSADGYEERFPKLAVELVRLKVDIVVALGTP